MYNAKKKYTGVNNFKEWFIEFNKEIPFKIPVTILIPYITNDRLKIILNFPKYLKFLRIKIINSGSNTNSIWVEKFPGTAKKLYFSTLGIRSL